MGTKEEAGWDRLTAARMNGYSARLKRDSPSSVAKPALEIDLLNKEEVRGVESTHVIPRLAPYEQYGSGRPFDIREPSAGRAGEIPEPPLQAGDSVEKKRPANHPQEAWEAVCGRLGRSVLVDQTWGDRADRSVVLKNGAELSNGSAVKRGVCIDREDVSWRKEGGSVVNGRSVAEVRPYLRDSNGWPTCTYMLSGAVGRDVVYDGDRYVGTVLPQETRDTRVEPPPTVMAWNDGRDESARARFDDFIVGTS
jgi:hypothetical protein